MMGLKLFLAFFKIGLFSFGGGYAMLPMIQQEVVTSNHWISQEAFANLLGISQATPGPIAVNAATFVGYKTLGVTGALLATIGVILPSVLIICIFAVLMKRLKGSLLLEKIMKNIRLVAIGLIASAAISLRQDALVNPFSFLIFLSAFIASWRYKADPILLIVAAGFLGWLFL